jgi:hypothetical protein
VKLESRLTYWRERLRTAEQDLQDASPWLWPVMQADITLINRFIAHYQARLHRANGAGVQSH